MVKILIEIYGQLGEIKCNQVNHKNAKINILFISTRTTSNLFNPLKKNFF